MNRPAGSIRDDTVLASRALVSRAVDATFGPCVFAIGLANLWLVHPVPGVVGLLLSLAYVPSVRQALAKWTGVPVPLKLRIALGLAVVWFTLGVSDLGDMID